MNKKNLLNALAITLFLVSLTLQTPVLAMGAAAYHPSTPALTEAQSGSCHFGITSVGGVNGYDLSVLGVGSYLDWGSSRNAGVASNIDYYRVLSVGDRQNSYSILTQYLQAKIAAQPGATWIVGNEPDSEVLYQDHLSAENYAERFYNVATVIRQVDPSAKIVFGTVIQPTPVRVYYLDRVITRLTTLAGSRANALSLIDIYSIHAFILNEEWIYGPTGGSWGAGLPIGYGQGGTWPAPQIISGYNIVQTVNINTFKSGIERFRQWMKGLGDQNKPLWITEYGSLMPDWYVTDEEAAVFMEQTFEYMLGTKDANLGYAPDSNRLVQKWLWYSLNGDVNQFGGSLIDPATGAVTAIGDRFIKYNPSTAIVPVTNPDVYIDTSTLTIKPGMGYYQVALKVGNNVSSDRLTGVTVDLYIGSTLVGSKTTTLPRCGGVGYLTVPLTTPLAGGSNYTFTARVSLLAGNGTDLNPANNSYTFATGIVPGFNNTMLPLIGK